MHTAAFVANHEARRSVTMYEAAEQATEAEKPEETADERPELPQADDADAGTASVSSTPSSSRGSSSSSLPRVGMTSLNRFSFSSSLFSPQAWGQAWSQAQSGRLAKPPESGVHNPSPAYPTCDPESEGNELGGAPAVTSVEPTSAPTSTSADLAGASTTEVYAAAVDLLNSAEARVSAAIEGHDAEASSSEASYGHSSAYPDFAYMLQPSTQAATSAPLDGQGQPRVTIGQRVKERLEAERLVAEAFGQNSDAVYFQSREIAEHDRALAETGRIPAGRLPGSLPDPESPTEASERREPGASPRADVWRASQSVTEAEEWDEMAPVSRRGFVQQGLTAVARTRDAAQQASRHMCTPLHSVT